MNQQAYSRDMQPTTIRLSAQTRDSLKAFGGDTYEATVIEALEALDAQQFWTQVDSALEHRCRLSADERARRTLADAEVAAAFDGIG